LRAEDCEKCRAMVSVTGTGEVKAAPDYVEIALGVEIRNRDLQNALGQNDDRIHEILALARKSGIEDKDLQTDYVSIRPSYNDSKNGRTLEYYLVRKSVRLTLRDLSKFESLFSALVQAGANHVDGVEFGVKDIRKLRDQAREMAVVAAREKAEAMAGKLGQKIGKAFRIEESLPPVENQYGGGYARGYANAAQSLPGGEAGSGFAPGQIKVEARVSIQFELLQ